MVLVQNRIEYKVEKLKYNKVEVMPPKIDNKSECPVGAGAWYTKWIAKVLSYVTNISTMIPSPYTISQ